MSLVPASLTATVPIPLSVVAIISPRTSIIHRASDDQATVRQFLALEPGGALAFGAFPLSTPAMCWLMDPVADDTVTAASLHTSVSGASRLVDSAGWLAVVSRGSRSCFEVDQAGMAVF